MLEGWCARRHDRQEDGQVGQVVGGAFDGIGGEAGEVGALTDRDAARRAPPRRPPARRRSCSRAGPARPSAPGRARSGARSGSPGGRRRRAQAMPGARVEVRPPASRSRAPAARRSRARSAQRKRAARRARGRARATRDRCRRRASTAGGSPASRRSRPRRRSARVARRRASRCARCGGGCPAPRPPRGRRRACSAPRGRRSRASRTGIPHVRTSATARAKRSGSGHSGCRPRPLVSGSSSQAVPGSTTPSMKNLATPPRQRSPCCVAQQRPALELVPRRVDLDVQRRDDAHAQLAARLQLAQLVVRGRRAVHGVDGGQPGRRHAPQALGAALAALLVRRLRHDAQNGLEGRRLEQRARGAAVPAHDLGAALERARAVDARGRERRGRGERGVEVEERQQRRRPADGVRDELARQLHPVERGVLERVPRDPPPRAAARVLGRERCTHRGDRRRGPRGRPRPSRRLPSADAGASRRAPARAPSRVPSIVSVRASHAARTAASSPTATIVPARQATAVAHGCAGVERPDPRTEHGRIGGAAHRRERSGLHGTIARVAATTTSPSGARRSSSPSPRP